jgi:hypothetical protein
MTTPGSRHSPYDQLVAFTPDGRLMALEVAPAVIHLKEVATGRTVARFEDPHGDRATRLGFTPDGTRLVAVTHYAGAIHVWDLRAIRAEKAVRLAPENPNYRNMLGVSYYRAGRYREAVEALRPNLEHQVDWALPSDLYFEELLGIPRKHD